MIRKILSRIFCGCECCSKGSNQETPEIPKGSKKIVEFVGMEPNFSGGLFDYEQAHLLDVGYMLYSDDYILGSLGREGWAPVSFCMLLAEAYEGSLSLRLLREAIENRFTIAMGSEGSEAVRDWAVHNSSVIEMSFAGKNIEEYEARSLKEDLGDDHVQDGFKGFCVDEARYLYMAEWQRFNIRTDRIFLSCSEHMNAFGKLQDVGERRKENGAYWEKVTAWTLDWFESIGFEVDRKRKFIRVEDFKPLYLQQVDCGA